MPYRKKTYKPKYRKNLAPTVRRIVSSMDEKKYIIANNSFNVTQTQIVKGFVQSGATGLGSGITQGTDVDDRIGNRIIVKEVKIAIHLNPLIATAMQNGATIRIALVHDKKPTGTVPAFSDIFESSAMAWCQKEQNVTRFRVLKQTTHNMVATSVNPTGPAVLACGPPYQFDWVIRPNKRVSFSSSTTTVAALITDEWYLVVGSDADLCCELDYAMKVKFTDA